MARITSEQWELITKRMTRIVKKHLIPQLEKFNKEYGTIWDYEHTRIEPRNDLTGAKFIVTLAKKPVPFNAKTVDSAKRDEHVAIRTVQITEDDMTSIAQLMADIASSVSQFGIVVQSERQFDSDWGNRRMLTYRFWPGRNGYLDFLQRAVRTNNSDI